MRMPAKRRLSRQEAQGLTRERLVEAARRLFVQKGFGSTSLRDIAEEAGYSQGAFYSNFACKEAILIELMRRHANLEDSEIEAIIDKQECAAEEILAELAAWFGSFEKDPNWSVLAIELQLHALRSPAFAESYARFWLEHEQRAAALIRRLFERVGKMPPVQAGHVAAGLIALANGLAVQESAIRQPPIAAIIIMFLQAILASEPDMPKKRIP